MYLGHIMRLHSNSPINIFWRRHFQSLQDKNERTQWDVGQSDKEKESYHRFLLLLLYHHI